MSVCVQRYAGQYRDPVSLGYALGNGYRHYSPALMRFTAPDVASPFSAGGVNPYAYCAGDPINRRDPSGYSFLSVLGHVFADLIAAVDVVAGVAGLVASGGASLVPSLVAISGGMTSLGGDIESMVTKDPKKQLLYGTLSGLAGVAASLGVASAMDAVEVARAVTPCRRRERR
jgi:RHS repeat-associated protein